MNEAEVIQYLSDKPDFFVKNPELLESLTLPHPVHGRVVSLLEYQVDLLRKSTSDYRREFDRLIDVARENEAIMQKTRRFILAGLECHTLDEFAVVIDDMVRDDFAASRHAFVLFGDAQDSAIRCCSAEEVVTHLATIPKMKQSACGGLSKKELAYLFQEDASDIQSHAVMPIMSIDKGKKHAIGVLVLGASSKNTFAKKKENLFLEHIAELLNVLIQRLSS
ncbi:DUF484 family protein [Marinomonas sp. NPDC078689]|uniref:DUF484 family protein n=1 Tax=Marinomonas sp. NPDC078689 TaxID=3364147 RepID=UPI0037C7E736